MNQIATKQNQETDGVSVDAFLEGKLEIHQPTGKAHRSGLDALLLAACIPGKAKGRLCDLGSGVGVAGLVAAATRPNLNVTLVEKNPELVVLARRNIASMANACIASRAKTLTADVTLGGRERETLGLAPDTFDYVIMNPPYNDVSAFRSSDDLSRAEAHMMATGGLDAWMRTAVAILKPKGLLAMIYRTSALGQIIAATQGRLGGLSLIPVHSRSDEPSKRILVVGTKGSRAPLSLLPPLVIHQADGTSTKLAKDIINGKAGVFPAV